MSNETKNEKTYNEIDNEIELSLLRASKLNAIIETIASESTLIDKFDLIERAFRRVVDAYRDDLRVETIAKIETKFDEIGALIVYNR